MSSTDARELEAALQHFAELLGHLEVDELLTLGPAAVYTASVTTWLMVYQRLHAGCSLQTAVDGLMKSEPGFLPANKRVRNQSLSSATGSYSQARQRLTPEITEHVANGVFESLMSATPPFVEQRRVFLLDGTTLSLAPTKSLQAAFPPATNQYDTGTWPIAHLVVAHEIAAGVAILPELGQKYGPQAESETALAIRMLPRLPERSIVIADRNFGIFAVAFAAKQAGHDALVRLTSQRFNALRKRAQGDVLHWTPTAQERRDRPELPADAHVQGWLHDVLLPNGNPLRLLTTWPCSSAQAAAIYHQRQDIETDIRDLKMTLKFEEFRGQTPAMLRKELATGIVAYNLVLQIRRLAAKRAKLPPRRLSFSRVYSAVRTILLSGPSRSAGEWQADFDLVIKLASQRKIPNRPGRSYPRKALVKRNKSTSGNRNNPRKQTK